MIAKSILTLEGVHAAAPMKLFASLNADGSLNWAETRGVLTVYCNKVRKGSGGAADVQYSDQFELRVVGESNLKTIASHVYKGKAIDRVTCFVSMPQKDQNGNKRRVAIKCDENGNPKKDANGQYIYVDVPTLNVQSVELGPDTEAYEREKGEAAIAAAKLQGTIHPDVDPKTLMNVIMTNRRTKGKNQDWNLGNAVATGAWGHATIWSKDKGNWQPGGQAQATAGTTQPNPMAGMDPETVRQFFEFQRMQAAMAAGGPQPEAPKTASASEATSAPEAGPSAESNEVPDDGSYEEVPF